MSDLVSFGLAGLLGGCPASLSGWHVPESGRRFLLSKQPRAALIELFGRWLEFLEAYEDAPPDRRVRCLCGWRPGEDAVLALIEMADLIARMERPEKGVQPSFVRGA